MEANVKSLSGLKGWGGGKGKELLSIQYMIAHLMMKTIRGGCCSYFIGEETDALRS